MFIRNNNRVNEQTMLERTFYISRYHSRYDNRTSGLLKGLKWQRTYVWLWITGILQEFILLFPLFDQCKVFNRWLEFETFTKAKISFKIIKCKFKNHLSNKVTPKHSSNLKVDIGQYSDSPALQRFLNALTVKKKRSNKL